MNTATTMITVAAINTINVIVKSVEVVLASFSVGHGDAVTLEVGRCDESAPVGDGVGLADELEVAAGIGDEEVLANGVVVGDGLLVGETEGVGDIDGTEVGEGDGEGVSGVELNAKAFDSAVKLQLATFATC